MGEHVKNVGTKGDNMGRSVPVTQPPTDPNEPMKPKEQPKPEKEKESK